MRKKEAISKTAKARVPSVDGAAYLRKQLQDPDFRYQYEQRLLILEIARTVKGLRKNAGLTQAQLAKLIGSTQPAIARLENPESERVASFDTLHKIATALGRQLTLRMGLDLAEPEGKRKPLLSVSAQPVSQRP